MSRAKSKENAGEDFNAKAPRREAAKRRKNLGLFASQRLCVKTAELPSDDVHHVIRGKD